MGKKKVASEVRQEQADVQMQFLMQNMLNGVLVQLERIERVVLGIQTRTNPMKCNAVGDRNHQTTEDNFQALKAKLMAFSSASRGYHQSFTPGCIRSVCEWISRGPGPRVSPEYAQALLDTLNACEGRYQPDVRPVRLNEAALQELSERLALAAHHWHTEEEKFNRDPQAFKSKTQMYPVIAKHGQVAFNVEAIREQAQNCIRTPPTEQRPGIIEGGNEEAKVAAPVKNEQPHQSLPAVKAETKPRQDLQGKKTAGPINPKGKSGTNTKFAARKGKK